MSLKLVPLESLGAVSYSLSIATMAVSLAVSIQLANVTDRHRTTAMVALVRDKKLRTTSGDTWRIVIYRGEVSRALAAYCFCFKLVIVFLNSSATIILFTQLW